MKNKSTWMIPFLLLTIVLTVLSCRKETGVLSLNNSEQTKMAATKGPVTRAYRDSFQGSLHFKPDIASGWTFPNNSPAWFYGSAEGNATHMGRATSYFNQYTLKNSAGVVMVYHSPVNMFYKSQLESYNVPSNVSGVMLDGKGNSIWIRNAEGGITSQRISPTRINMDGTMLIVGGTGKFAGATGETSFHAYFNPLNLQEFSSWQNGWIRY